MDFLRQNWKALAAGFVVLIALATFAGNWLINAVSNTFVAVFLLLLIAATVIGAFVAIRAILDWNPNLGGEDQ
jgi:succinate dehydrogenase hydrophobic anchor subunit